ncbi:MAG: M15 family metallopeptidase, partial [Defluviitaleaceae bacterium]|nr:M15 family metallopeptidase [Defluviitaleaceae bacterium]
TIVTNARGGQSIHNYRLAFDFFRNVSGQAFNDSTPAERAFWNTAGRIWVEMGGVWGGNWTSFVDRPHCEFTGGLTLHDLQAGKQLPKDAKMPWELYVSENEVEAMRFNLVDEMPDWAQPTIKRLIEKGHLRGNNGDGTGLDLSLDMVRILVLNDRAGLYGVE